MYLPRSLEMFGVPIALPCKTSSTLCCKYAPRSLHCYGYEIDLAIRLIQQYNDTTDQLCSYYGSVCPSNESSVDNCQPCSASSDKNLLKQTVIDLQRSVTSRHAIDQLFQRINEVYSCATDLCIDRTICAGGNSPNITCYNQYV